MSASESTSKNKMWKNCADCGTAVHFKDFEEHLGDCPPNDENKSYFHIRNNCLYGNLQVAKDTAEIYRAHNYIYISEPCQQKGKFPIDSLVVVKAENTVPFVKRVYKSKDFRSINLTKKELDLYFGDVKNYPKVSVSKLTIRPPEASEVILIPKSKQMLDYFEMQSELRMAYQRSVLTAGNKVRINFMECSYKYLVKEIRTESKGIYNDIYYLVSSKTKWTLYESNKDEQNLASKIGGLDVEMKMIRKLMDKPNCKSVLLHGFSGTGKTMVAQALAKEREAKFIYVERGDPEDIFDKIIQKIIQYESTILVLDDLNFISCSKTFDKICSVFNKLKKNPELKVFIIGITSDVDKLGKEGMIKKGLFENIIEIPIPNLDSKRDIINKVLSCYNHNLNTEDISVIIHGTPGYTGYDICKLFETAIQSNDSTTLNIADIIFAFQKVKPEMMKEFDIKVPDVKWLDIAGQDALKEILKVGVVEAAKNPELYKKFKRKPPNGFLLYGPPGCSKTMIAKALATQSRMNFFSVKGPELLSKYVGNTEKAIRDLFKKAQQAAPSIIFFDEFDSIATQRECDQSQLYINIVGTLNTLLDGISDRGNVVVIAATNRPHVIAPSLLRSGRISRKIYVPLPDEKTRAMIFKLQLEKMEVADSSVDLQILATLTEGYCGADIPHICDVVFENIEKQGRHVKSIVMEDFTMALKTVRPSVSPECLRICEEYNKLQNGGNDSQNEEEFSFLSHLIKYKFEYLAICSTLVHIVPCIRYTYSVLWPKLLTK